VNGVGRHLDLLNGRRRRLALLNGRRWGLPRFNGVRRTLARLKEGRRVLLSVLNNGQWRRRRQACVNGGLEERPGLKSSVWHLVLKLRRLSLKHRRQLVSADGHGSPRPRWRAAPAGNDVSRPGETNRSGLGGWGPREGRRGGAPGGCLRKDVGG
jgi:hypothetical protein